tara:strand:+ start:170 stop:592 length:423 start_codon:yes stop_codon:yes gene_type:complete
MAEKKKKKQKKTHGIPRREPYYAAPPRDPDPIFYGAPPSKRQLGRLRALMPEPPLTAEESADLTADSILDRRLERRILKPARDADIMRRRERRRKKVEDAYEPSYKRGGKVKQGYKKGGSVKSKSIDGIAQHGKTRGTMR